MLTAAIDAGSNTLRLLIGEAEEDRLARIYTERHITRLAAGISETGLLREKNMQQSILAIKSFSDSIKRHGAKHVRAVGTSALREAKNSRAFIDNVFSETGLLIEIISGEEEAVLTAKGVLLGFKDTADEPLIIDIGGGSTEWIIRQKRTQRPPAHGTIPLGVVNLAEKFIKTDPPSDEDIKALIRGIDTGLDAVKYEILNHIYPNTGIIATGGTVTTIAAIDLGLNEYSPEKVHLHNIPLERLCSIRDKLISMPLTKRQDIAGLEPKRADLIIPGILLTIRVMEILGFSKLAVSDYGILEGLIAG